MTSNHDNIEASFLTLAMSIASGAAISMGLAPDPQTQKKSVNISMARFNIDLLDILKTKTKGNLLKEEQDFMDRVCADLKIQFLEVSKREQKS